MMSILTANNISYIPESSGTLFGKQNSTSILKDVSLTINKGSITAITGESGSGKTTLAKILAGILTPTSGMVNFPIININKKTTVQLLFQNSDELINPFRSVSALLNEAYLINNNNGQIENTKKIIDMLGLPEAILAKKGYQLSGGERQRVALGRLLAVGSEVLILDEPFSAQDLEAQKNLLLLIKKIKDELKTTFVCISHNLKVLRKLADYIYVMKNGEIVDEGITEDIFNSPKHPYTKYLLKAEKLELSIEELLYE